jgi:hypothetical protein
MLAFDHTAHYAVANTPYRATLSPVNFALLNIELQAREPGIQPALFA